MSSQTKPRNFLFALFVAFFALFGMTPAQAHDELVSSDPASGETLQSTPQEITLTYSAELMEIGNEVHVTNSAGETVSDGDAQTTGRDIVQKIKASETPDETYTVTWRVVSSDGHPIQGKYDFTVGQGAQASASDTASASSAPAEANTENTADAKTGFTPLNIGIFAVAALAALGVLATVLAKNRKR